ncbi:MAG: peptide chain release factor N(5)-glutamine methyltransferase [Lachnospiraceae bacterium]|nr:peptide chain release factor N(5)-glutamine methyltransferase [Lachnospiraceae bacterium]
MVPCQELYQEGRKQLTEAGIGEAALDARLLLEYACGITHELLLAHPDKPVAKEAAKAYLELIAQRAKRVPVAYLTKTQEFMGLTFKVNENVLIPNPDTETLVEAALKCLQGDKRDRSGGDKGDGFKCHLNSKVTFGPVPFVTSTTTDDTVRILDLCTGSGCVGLSLLHYSTGTTLVATDISEDALHVARENAHALGLAERAAFVCCDVYPSESRGTGTLTHFSQCREQPTVSAEKRVSVPVPMTHRYNLIVANPPYIATDVIETLAPEVKCAEPRLALDGGADGLAFYRRILKDIETYLAPGGSLVVEIGFDQGNAVAEMFRAAGLKNVKILKDLNGLDRVVAGHR